MFPAFSVCADDGSVHIDGCATVIRPRMRIEVARSELASFYRSEIDHGNGYHWLTFGEFSLQQQPARLSLCFHEGQLNQLNFHVEVPHAKYEDRWPTQETSKREVSVMRSVLRKQLGRQFASGEEEFPWGAAWAKFDIKGFMASAGLHYDLAAKPTPHHAPAPTR